MLMVSDLKAGQTVQVKTSFGVGPVVVGIVQGVYRDIKNGRPGIDYSVDGHESWAYLDQVVEVLKNS